MVARPSSEPETPRPQPPHADRPIRWRHRRSPDCICSSARMPRRRWWCPGTRCSPFAVPASCSGVSTASSSKRSRPQAASYTDAKSGQVVYAYHAKLGRLQADFAYLYGAHARRRRAGVRHVPHLAAWSRAVHVHQLRRSGHADARQEVRAARGGDDAESALRERQSRLAGGGRYHARRGAAAALVPSVQRRSLLRQSRRGPGADLVGFLGEQQPQRPQTSLDAVARQPRERARQRADRLSGLSDLLLGAGGGRPDRGDARALVRLHRRLGARHQHRQRRRRLPGRRQFLRPGLFVGRAEGLAGKGIGRRPSRS